MPQTKRKRKTKHRGNAAGIVEVRGRTGRPLTAADRKATTATQTSAQRRDARMSVPPTWKSAAKKALIPTAMLAVFFFIVGNPASFIVLGLPLFGLYTAMSYYVDLWSHRRYMRKKSEGKT